MSCWTNKEERFDKAFEDIVVGIIDCFCKASAKKSKRFRYHEFVYDWYTNSKDFIRTVTEVKVTGDFAVDRTGMVAVTQSVQDILLLAIQDGVLDIAKKERKASGNIGENSVKNLSAEVNHFFGWAIFKAWRKCRKELRQKREEDAKKQGVSIEELDDFEEGDLGDDIDDDDDNDSECLPSSKSRSQIELESVSAFLGRMFIRHDEAMQDKEYLENYYDIFYMVYNCGGLTLVSKQYFEFGKKLLETAANALTQDTINDEGNACMVEGRKRLVGENDNLWQEFIKCDSETTLAKETRVEIFDFLVKKTRNARHYKEINTFKEDNAKKKGKDHVGQALRTRLDTDNVIK